MRLGMSKPHITGAILVELGGFCNFDLQTGTPFVIFTSLVFPETEYTHKDAEIREA